MSWISTALGNKIDFANPDPAQIDIEDIAAGLAVMPRWAGQTMYGGKPCFYSVAQHSWYASNEFHASAYPMCAMLALLHDAPEAYMGDCPRPLKELLGRTWEAIETRVLEAIFLKYDVRPNALSWQSVKRVDDRLLITERRDLQPFCPDWDAPADGRGPWPDPYEWHIEPLGHERAREQFIARFYKLRSLLSSARVAR